MARLDLQWYFVQAAQGNWVSRYDDQGKADHYAHAETYCQIAVEWGERWILRAV